MKKLLTILMLVLTSSIFAQEDKSAEFEKLYKEQKYDDLVSYSSKAKEYSAKSVYYIGMGYYMKAEDNNCLKMMNLALEKDAKNADAHYIKGMTYNYMGKFNDGIKSIENAIALNDTNGHFYSAIGDANFELGKMEKALEFYQKATKQMYCPDRPFVMIPQVYNEIGDKENALKMFHIAKENIDKKSDSYRTVLYNIGLFEYLKKNYHNSEKAYRELLEIDSTDFHVFSKMMQIHYARNEYKEALPYKEKLYKAHAAGLLEDNLKNMFCFDQFDWKGKRVQVFENFAQPEGKLYYKHLFYLIDENGNIQYRVQTENSPVTVELGGDKYMLGMDHNGTHYNYGPVAENFDYAKLKERVCAIFDNQINPAASTGSFSRDGKKKTKKRKK